MPSPSFNKMVESTWKCGELKLYFCPSAGGLKKKKKKKDLRRSSKDGYSTSSSTNTNTNTNRPYLFARRVHRPRRLPGRSTPLPFPSPRLPTTTTTASRYLKIPHRPRHLIIAAGSGNVRCFLRLAGGGSGLVFLLRGG